MKQAIEAKANAHLNQKMRYKEGIMTRREWLNYWMVKGATTKEVQEPKVIYNRIKYNRMTGWEQEEYEKKCNEMKTGYRLNLPGSNSMYDLTKTEYDYFNSLVLSEDIQTEKHDLQNRIEAGIATDQEIEEDEQKEFNLFSKYFK